MQLSDLVKPIEEQSDDELRQRLEALRSRRDIERPAKVRHEKKSVTKQTRKKINPIEKMFDGMSPEQIEKLLKEFGA